jgi:hypothetical protein
MSVLARDKIMEAIEAGEITITPHPQPSAFGCASVGMLLLFRVITNI